MFLFFHDSTCAMCTFPSSTNNFAHAQALSRMSSVRSYEYCAGKHWKLYWMQENHSIKQRRISIVLGYLRMILWKISTAISIKHRILATFNIEKKFNSDSLYAFKFIFFIIASWIPLIIHITLFCIFMTGTTVIYIYSLN